jgi:hypothetical protein
MTFAQRYRVTMNSKGILHGHHKKEDSDFGQTIS